MAGPAITDNPALKGKQFVAEFLQRDVALVQRGSTGTGTIQALAELRNVGSNAESRSVRCCNKSTVLTASGWPPILACWHTQLCFA
jgi:hypothetical protein